MTWDPNYKRPNPRTKYRGVYRILHVPSGACYIGGSVDITGRYTHHRYCLRRGIHKTKALQSLWTKDGEDCFKFEVVELCGLEDLLSREDYHIKNTSLCLNTADSAITGHYNCGPSDTKKAAAVKRWQRPDYRDKRANQMANRDANGRLLRN